MSKKSALMVWGGWLGHQPRECVALFAAELEREGFEVTVSDSLASFEDDAELSGYSLIVPCWTMGELSGAQEKGLLDAVRAGTGLAGWHGGMCDAFRNSPGYQFMTGGQWVEHPGGIVEYTVNIVRRDDPVVAGLDDFRMRSELYYMHVDPSNEVLASVSVDGAVYPWIAGCVMPAVWKRAYGRGRVFYSALGHQVSDFDVPECFAVMKRGMLWANRSAETEQAS